VGLDQVHHAVGQVPDHRGFLVKQVLDVVDELVQVAGVQVLLGQRVLELGD
jgi:hypothetical protein